MVGLHTDVSPLQPTLQETPEVLNAVGVNLVLDVLFGVVDDLVNVVAAQRVVGL